MNAKKKNIIVIDRKYVVLLIIPLAILAKIIRYTPFMDKLVDNASGIKILYMVLYPEQYPYGLVEEGTFWISANIFRAINVLHLSTTFQWEIFFASLFNIVCIFFILKGKKKVQIWQSIFLLSSIGLLNMFVFMLSKDIIQFVFFLFIYVTLARKNLTPRQKIIASSIILLLCGALYRTYFLLIAVFFLIIIVLSKKLIRKEKVTFSLFVKTIFIYYCLFGAVLFISNYIVPEILSKVISIRSETLYHLELMGSYPSSALREWWPSISVLTFLANHFVITVRMLIPLELLTLGVKYIPFVFYQILVTVKLYQAIKRTRYNSNACNLAIYIYLAFILGSAIFEPDYGSWVRHEAAAFPIMFYVIDSSPQKSN